MKKIILFLVLILGWLTLFASSSEKEKEHVVLRGKLIFKEKYLPIMKFELIDKLGGYYSLIIFQETKINDSKFLIEKSLIVKSILKERIYSKLDSYSIKNEKNIDYLSFYFSNIELKSVSRFRILLIGIDTIYELEKKLGCHIYARLE